jgi:hypothetical protein
MNHSRDPSITGSETERNLILEQSEAVDGERTGELTGESADELTRSSAWIEVQILKEQQIVAHRGIWSFWLLGLVCLITVSGILFVFMVGLGWINFVNPEVTIPAFIAANLAQTYGLGKLVVKFLFNDKGMK